jgi:hypothetical protein
MVTTLENDQFTETLLDASESLTGTGQDASCGRKSALCFFYEGEK